MPLPMMPPSIHGVTAGGGPPSPLAMLSRMLASKPETAAQELINALASLRRVARLDPRLEDKVGDAIRLLVEAVPDDGDHERSGGGGSHGDFQGIMTP